MEKKSRFFKKTSGLMAFLFILAFAMPAQAFYVEVPKDFAQNWQSLIASKAKEIKEVLGVKVLGIEEVNNPLPSQEMNNPAPQTCRVNGVDMPGSCDQYNNTSGSAGNTMLQNQPWAGMCSNNTALACVDGAGKFVASAKVGSDGKPVCPANSSAQCGNYQQNNQQDQNQGGQNQGGQNQGGQNQGGQEKKNQERMMQDVKRNIKQMESNLKRLETVFKNAEAKGTTIPTEVKDKLKEARSVLEAMKSAQTAEAMQAIDMGALNETMQSLEQSRQEIIDSVQRMNDMKRGVKGMESGLKAFESQIAKLAKQKIVIPTEVTENLNKVKTIISAVKNAKTMDEMEATGAENLQEAMQNLDESRGQMEMLARWPQTLKQLNSELSRLTSELKKAKTIVEKLKKTEIDLSDTYAQFEAAVAKLKTVKEEAEKNIKAGGSADVFDAIQEDFFGQMEETMQYQRVIMTMSNLGRFASDFKKGIAQAQSQIRKLKAKKIDTGEAEMMLNDFNNKGKEILVMLKAKPIVEDDITLALEEMEGLGQEFGDKISELTGVEDIMPWEQGPQQFKQPQMPDNWQQLMPQKSQTQNCPPCNCPSQNCNCPQNNPQ
jgi:hypothetical protein